LTRLPIRRVEAENFGPFESADIDLAPALNIIVGENGAGKSQLLKLLYTVTNVLATPDALSGTEPRRAALNQSIAAKLVEVFRPDSLGRLSNRRHGRSRSSISVSYGSEESILGFSFASSSRSEVKVGYSPDQWIADSAVFFPTRELLSIYPGFVSLYNERQLEFDATWRDTADLLGRPPLRGPRGTAVNRILAPIEASLGGSIIEESGRFYLKHPGVGTLEMHLVAEGLRKLGMLVRLVSSGTLLHSGYLFWDEPEANLNPKTLRGVARTIYELADAGVQVFVATHSLFLLRELEILLAQLDPSAVALRARTQFIGLHREIDSIKVSQGPSLYDVGDITALDEELQQSDRYLALT
jgi:ABC-type transport system involved in cytochrome c biogenesis ATPase subunit